MTKLEKMIHHRGLSQAELARRMRVSRQCVCLAVKKGIRNAAAATRYAEALNCHALDLIEV